MTDAQIEAVTAVTTDMLPNLGGTKRGAQVFTDITHKGLPEGATDDPMEPDDEPPMKRARTDDVHAEDDFEYWPEISPEDVQIPPQPEQRRQRIIRRHRRKSRMIPRRVLDNVNKIRMFLSVGTKDHEFIELHHIR